ncbi:MAG: hypothetical protein Q9162_004986 [Coniocarpon cinnabarinum]
MAFPRVNGYPPGPGYPNGNYAQSPAPQPLRSGAPPQMSRAQQFEDEKKRIQASCFGKMDEKNQGPMQSYITHIRVEEDGAYPSEPPPPDADPQYKKQRVIIAAVKQTGRVYLHKARENDDRTFQIGKTWPLEELSMIETFSARGQRSHQDLTRAHLGGDVGFVITIAKPYFWKAKTPKEKAFFIGSVVKIFRKYTNGKLPKLVGFDPEEEAQLIAASELSPAIRQQPQQHPLPPSHPHPPYTSGHSLSPLPQQPPGSAHPMSPGLGPPPIMPYAQKAPGSSSSLHSQEYGGGRRRRPSDGTMDSSSRRSPSAASSGRGRPPSPPRHLNEIPPLQTQHLGGPSPMVTPTSRSVTPNMRTRPSQDQMRSKTPDAVVPRVGYHASRSNVSSPAPTDDRANHRIVSSRLEPEAHELSRDPQAKSPSVYASPHDAHPSSTSISSSTAERWRPPGASAARDRPHTPNESIASNNSGPRRPSFTSDRSYGNTLNPSVPERRRPTLEKGSFASQNPEAIEEESMPQPLRSKKSEASDSSSAPVAPPPLQTNVSSFKKPNLPSDTNGRPRKSEESKPVPTITPAPASAVPTSANPQSSSRPSTPENQEIKEDSASPGTPKPGLGPMVGKKLLDGNVANKWKKVTQAATAANAFKPRAGGAGARLLASKNKSADEGPDGVTGVVPAPSLRGTTGDGLADRLNKSKSGKGDLQVAGALPPVNLDLEDGQDSFSVRTDERPTVTEETEPQLAYQYENALKALDVDPTVLGGQGQEYEATLTEFGWANSILQSKTIDSMETDMRREIARLEAGPWLGQETEDGAHKDAGVDAFEKVLDKAIAECDEMERLLSLYGVELAVSSRIAFIFSRDTLTMPADT